jgi:hypothetical protein
MICHTKRPRGMLPWGRFVNHHLAVRKQLRRDRLCQLCQTGDLATSGAFMQNTFLGGLIDGRLGSLKLRIQDLTVIFGYGLADILYDGLNAGFD